MSFGNLGNIGSLMKNAKKIQEMMEEQQRQLETLEITGESGAGAVTIVMTAKHVVKSVKIDDEIIKESKEVLEELIAAAFTDAIKKIEDATKDQMGGITDMFGG